MKSFHDQILEYITDESKAIKLADEFSVSLPTIYRWAQGISHPHPERLKHILEKLKKMNTKLDEGPFDPWDKP